MKTNDQTILQFLCRALARAVNTAVRLYENGTCVDYYSVFHLHPDPAGPFLADLLDETHRAGVYCTPLLQFYGFLSPRRGTRIIIGPTCLQSADQRRIDEYLFLLRVSAGEKAQYLHTLRCFPEQSAERLAWLVAFLASAADNAPYPMEQLYFNVRPQEHAIAVQSRYAQQQEQQAFAPDDLRDKSYQYEKLLLSLVRQGETDRLRELLDAPPMVQIGKMSDDTLRQAKNTGVCTAAIVSRAAIDGGLDNRTAFLLSDLYIQKIELLGDIPSLEKLRGDIMLDYADRVRRLRYRVHADESGSLFAACAEYVAQNLYTPLRVEEVAAALGYSRSYLSSRFKAQAGMTLSQYILQEKIFEAQRLLQFTDNSLLDIAGLLGFSSQSHFQNVFKTITGETPMAYRKRST